MFGSRQHVFHPVSRAICHVPSPVRSRRRLSKALRAGRSVWALAGLAHRCQTKVGDGVGQRTLQRGWQLPQDLNRLHRLGRTTAHTDTRVQTDDGSCGRRYRADYRSRGTCLYWSRTRSWTASNDPASSRHRSGGLGQARFLNLPPLPFKSRPMRPTRHGLSMGVVVFSPRSRCAQAPRSARSV